MTEFRSACWCASLLLYFTCVQRTMAGASYAKDAAISEAAGTVRITANSPRPLEQVLDALQRKYGWVVNYEDPQYVSAVDVVKGSDENSRLPAGSNFTFEFASASPDEEKTLRQMIDSYNKSKNPGHFELRHTADGVFHVVGVAGRNDKGELVEQKAPFDLPLTLAKQEQTIDETMAQICAEVSKQSRSQVVLAISPRRILLRNRVSVGGSKVEARELLVQSLLAAHEKLYWRLLFDPTSKSYYLDLHVAHSS